MEKLDKGLFEQYTNDFENQKNFKLGFKEALIYFDSMNMLNYK